MRKHRHAQAVGPEVRERARSSVGRWTEQVVEVHRDVGEREQPLLALRLEPVGQRRQRVAGLERRAEPVGVVPEEERERRQEADDQRRPTGATGAPRASRDRPFAPARAAGAPQRDRRARERQRRPGEERGADEQAHQERAPLAEQLGQQSSVRIDRDEVAGVPHAAAGRHPPDLGPEAQQQDAAANRSRRRATPIRPGTHQREHDARSRRGPR